MRRLGVIVLTAAVLVPGCAAHRPAQKVGGAELSKIAFDLDAIDGDGLTGPSHGRRAVSYEFCIPDDPATKAEVEAIDPTLTVYPGSKGRIGCVEGEALCIGSTHQPGFREVLSSLSRLEYVRRIEQCFFE